MPFALAAPLRWLSLLPATPDAAAEARAAADACGSNPPSDVASRVSTQSVAAQDGKVARSDARKPAEAEVADAPGGEAAASRDASSSTSAFSWRDAAAKEEEAAAEGREKPRKEDETRAAAASSAHRAATASPSRASPGGTASSESGGAREAAAHAQEGTNAPGAVVAAPPWLFTANRRSSRGCGSRRSRKGGRTKAARRPKTSAKHQPDTSDGAALALAPRRGVAAAAAAAAALCAAGGGGLGDGGGGGISSGGSGGRRGGEWDAFTARRGRSGVAAEGCASTGAAAAAEAEGAGSSRSACAGAGDASACDVTRAGDAGGEAVPSRCLREAARVVGLIVLTPQASEHNSHAYRLEDRHTALQTWCEKLPSTCTTTCAAGVVSTVSTINIQCRKASSERAKVGRFKRTRFLIERRWQGATSHVLTSDFSITASLCDMKAQRSYVGARVAVVFHVHNAFTRVVSPRLFPGTVKEEIRSPATGRLTAVTVRYVDGEVDKIKAEHLDDALACFAQNKQAFAFGAESLPPPDTPGAALRAERATRRGAHSASAPAAAAAAATGTGGVAAAAAPKTAGAAGAAGGKVTTKSPAANKGKAAAAPSRAPAGAAAAAAPASAPPATGGAAGGASKKRPRGAPAPPCPVKLEGGAAAAPAAAAPASRGGAAAAAAPKAPPALHRPPLFCPPAAKSAPPPRPLSTPSPPPPPLAPPPPPQQQLLSTPAAGPTPPPPPPHQQQLALFTPSPPPPPPPAAAAMALVARGGDAEGAFVRGMPCQLTDAGGALARMKESGVTIDLLHQLAVLQRDPDTSALEARDRSCCVDAFCFSDVLSFPASQVSRLAAEAAEMLGLSGADRLRLRIAMTKLK